MSDLIFYGNDDLHHVFRHDAVIRERERIINDKLLVDCNIDWGLSKAIKDLAYLSIYDSHPELFDMIMYNLRKHSLSNIKLVNNRRPNIVFLFNYLINDCHHDYQDDEFFSSIVLFYSILSCDESIRYCLRILSSDAGTNLSNDDFQFAARKTSALINAVGKVSTNMRQFDYDEYMSAFLFAYCNYNSLGSFLTDNMNNDYLANLFMRCSLRTSWNEIFHVNDDLHNGRIITDDFISKVSVPRSAFTDYDVFMRLVALCCLCDDSDLSFIDFIIREPLSLCAEYNDYPGEFIHEILKIQFNDYLISH